MILESKCLSLLEKWDGQLAWGAEAVSLGLFIKLQSRVRTAKAASPNQAAALSFLSKFSLESCKDLILGWLGWHPEARSKLSLLTSFSIARY